MSPPLPGRYVCREHHEPVSWRGTGCGGCARIDAELKSAEEARARRRWIAKQARIQQTYNQTPEGTPHA